MRGDNNKHFLNWIPFGQSNIPMCTYLYLEVHWTLWEIKNDQMFSPLCKKT